MLAPTIESQKSDIFSRKPCLLLVGACTAGPPTVRGIFFGLQLRQTRAGLGSASTMKSRNSAKIQTLSLAVYGRGGALLHPGSLAAAQGFSGRAMLAPTMKLQTSDMIFMKILPFACRGLYCRPANGAGYIGGGQLRQMRAEPSPAPTVKSRNSAKIQMLSLAVYGRGGALLHPGNLAVSQGFSGRALLAPTMKLQTSDVIFTQA